MEANDFRNELESIKANITTIESLRKRTGKLVDTQISTYKKLVRKSLERLEELFYKIKDSTIQSKESSYLVGSIKDLLDEMKTISSDKPEKLKPLVNECLSHLQKIKFVEQGLKISIPKLPPEISDSLKSDFEELEKCFNASAYRSCLILCGRIIETALHRKYYEETGVDLLETDPNIGIGKLIKRLNEEKILYPGLNEQIDMINQLRVYSVHKKKAEQKINKEQAHASILFTIDAVKKMFG